MLKRILILVIIVTVFLNCSDVQNNHASKEITLKGHVKFPETSTQFGLTLSKVDAQNNRIEIKKIQLDSTNNYNFKLSVDTIGFYEIDVYKTNRISFYADDEDLTINFRGIDTARMKIKNPPYIFIKGGPKNNVLNSLNYASYQNYQDMIAIGQEQYKASLSDSQEWKDHTASLWNPLYDNFDKRIRNIIQTYIDYPTVIKAVEYLSWKRDRELMLESYAYLANRFPELPFIQNAEQDLKDKIVNELRMAIGNVAPDFTFPDMNKKSVTLSSFIGKYVLIDFWASWCGPCRKETPHVQKLYKKYKDQLELVTVSIDTKLEDWKKAVEEDKMEGVLLIAQDSKQLQKDYVFSGIPFMVLLDQDGKIVGKNLRGESLESTLSEILDK